jgi:sulfane dehydrogenase subunit SoxC
MNRSDFFANLVGTAWAPLAIPESMQIPGDRVEPYGLPAASEHLRRRVTPSGHLAYAPLSRQFGSNTSNGLFYVVNHAGVPQIDSGAHKLVIHGLVRQSLVFTMDDIRRFPAVTRSHFLECSGNSGSEWSGPRAKDVQESHGLLSCAQWTGVRLLDVLNEAAVLPEAKWFIAEGADAAALDRSIPLEKAFDDALLVYGQNGEVIRPEQGYPLRLLLPGFEGNTNVKWIRRIKLTEHPVYSQQETGDYTDLLANGKARAFTFVMECKSVITRPSPGFGLTRRGSNQISGLAWSGRGKITRVEITLDGGKTWTDATLDEPTLSKCLTSFHTEFRWDGEDMLLQSRSTDETGYVQPPLASLVAVRGVNSFFHNNAIQTWHLAASGDVSNVHV